MSKVTDVTITSVIKNRDKNVTIKYLESVKNQTYITKIAITDFGSSQKNLTWERKVFAKYGVDFFIAKTNLEPFKETRGLNIAWKKVKTPYIIETGIDHVLSPNLIEETIKILKSDKKAFVLCQRTDISQDGKSKTLHVKGAVGAFMGFRTDWIKKVRGGDEKFFLWGAWDSDLVERAEKDGFKLKWVSDMADVTLYHNWHPKTPKPPGDDNFKYFKIPNKPIIRNPKEWGKI